jgi:hypothetical protein
LWSSTAVPSTLSIDDPNAVELGMQFTTSVNGFITGVRFYKGASNTGVHLGHLWTSSGTMLAEVTFAGETASGWQTASFASPIAVTANTTYVISYHTNTGYFSLDRNYFASGFSKAPITGLANGQSTPGNGVYRYGAARFPNMSYQASNYWVDVIFNTQ